MLVASRTPLIRCRGDRSARRYETKRVHCFFSTSFTQSLHPRSILYKGRLASCPHATQRKRVRKVFQHQYSKETDYGLHIAPAKCSWFSLDNNANPDMTYGPGELHPSSPMIKLNHTEAFQYQYNEPCVESTGMPANLPNSLSLDAFEPYFANAASAYANSPRTCGSTRVLGSFIGDPREIHLRLMQVANF